MPIPRTRDRESFLFLSADGVILLLSYSRGVIPLLFEVDKTLPEWFWPDRHPDVYGSFGHSIGIEFYRLAQETTHRMHEFRSVYIHIQTERVRAGVKNKTKLTPLVS